jgi:hypothetical protein
MRIKTLDLDRTPEGENGAHGIACDCGLSGCGGLHSESSSTSFQLASPSPGDVVRCVTGGPNSSGVGLSPYNARRSNVDSNGSATTLTASVVSPKRNQVISMVGIPGSSPKTRGQKLVGVIVFIAIMGFIVYVVVKNVFFS